MPPLENEHTLEFLLAFDGRIHHLEQGFWLKFEIRRVPRSTRRPHGLRYSFTLHDRDGNRLIGFDNAHGVETQGRRHPPQPAENDHWHRTRGDPGRPYVFAGAQQILTDFFAEVRRVLDEHGISDTVIGESETNRRSQT